MHKRRQLKPITAVAILLLVVASLSIAGCTTSTTTNQTPSGSASPSSATTSTATHDALLEKIIAEDKNYTYSSNILGNGTSWKLTWINGTSARVEWMAVNKSGNETGTITYDTTYLLLPTTQDATQYLNAMNKTGYNLTSTEYITGPYKTVTGHAPEVFKSYTRPEGTLGKSGYTLYGINQEDNIILVNTAKMVIVSS